MTKLEKCYRLWDK